MKNVVVTVITRFNGETADVGRGYLVGCVPNEVTLTIDNLVYNSNTVFIAGNCRKLLKVTA